MPKTVPEDQVRLIVSSHVPLGEDQETFDSIRQKVERREPLSRQEQKLLEQFAGKAKGWEDGMKSSSDTEREDTLAG